MVQCEMCGTETSAPKSIKVEGAELDVCENCANLGTEVSQPESETPTTKYSTGSGGDGSAASSASSTSSRSTSTGSAGGGGGDRDDDFYESLGDLAQDYDDRIRTAREGRGLSQEDLAKELNEKRSLIGKLERGETLPSDAIQRKLERYLEIDLTEGPAGDADWSSDEAGQSFTLGEMAERRE